MWGGDYKRRVASAEWRDEVTKDGAQPGVAPPSRRLSWRHPAATCGNNDNRGATNAVHNKKTPAEGRGLKKQSDAART